MSKLLPTALLSAIDELGRLPGVGERTAERYAYYLLRSDEMYSKKLSKAISQLHDSIKSCPVTFALINADEDISPLYKDSSRDKETIAVVEEPLDIVSIEQTGQFNGTYHVLGGAISPIDGIGPEQLHIPELLQRIKKIMYKKLLLPQMLALKVSQPRYIYKKALMTQT